MPRRLIISSLARPFSAKRAGRADLHALAAARTRVASPQGLLSSATSIELMPRAEISQTCAPSISPHTRTHREHRMQRL